jgi:ubiquinol-cytochrome c reductase cytochrome c subunit
MKRRLARLLRWWWRRPACTPAWLRVGVALILGTAGLFGVAASVSAGASGPAATTSPGRLAAVGGRPTSPRNSPAKSPFGPGPGSRTTSFPDGDALQAQGMSLYENGCASCHGTLLQGISGVAPSIQNVGAGPVDFYLSTGRMPLQAPHDQPERATPAYDPRQIDALIAFITAKGGGPAAPAANPAAGDLSTGFQVFTESCAGCHQIVGRGGMTVGAYVPNLQQASALQIAEAVRMGPYLMPHFDSKQIDQYQLDSLTKYIIQTRHPVNAGGWGIYNIGPIPEGIAAWFIALLALVIVARLIGERTGGEVR